MKYLIEIPESDIGNPGISQMRMAIQNAKPATLTRYVDLQVVSGKEQLCKDRAPVEVYTVREDK